MSAPAGSPMSVIQASQGGDTAAVTEKVMSALEQERYAELVSALLHDLNEAQPNDPLQYLNRKLTSASVSPQAQQSPNTAEEEEKPLYTLVLKEKALTIIVMGASGDLAKKKTFPALYKLHKQKLLPPHTRIVGYARSVMSPEEFHSRIVSYIDKEEDTASFKAMSSYVAGQYTSAADLAVLDKAVLASEVANGGPAGNRVFYLALPPSAFVDTCTSIKASAVPSQGWIRIVVEKPFGSDTDSSKKLSVALGALFREDQLYRIDHYLGKEMVQNLVTLRFANHIFGALWNRCHIANVQITFKEKIGTQGRGGYFDNFGIIRDVIQNHLTQILALVAMEKPKSLSAEHVRDEKVAVLECIRPVAVGDCVLGQYGRSEDGKEEAYLDDATVPKGSKCPTFASMVLKIQNDRWQDVPFILKAGKAMDKRMVTVRIQFRDEVRPFGNLAQRNELVIRMQPDEAMYMKISTKEPGVGHNSIQQTELELSYHKRYQGLVLPEAYESLINEVVNGNTTNFVRADELDAAWKIFTPLLHDIDAGKVSPVVYPFGSRGPTQSDDMLKNLGFERNENYEWRAAAGGANKL
jgi:glucose-6-phosphate 1-dehydrogenase